MSPHPLETAFRDQQQFAEGYSPLYARLFGIVADWLTADELDPLVDWLLTAAADRAPFETTLLLMAGLHRDVLAGEPAAAELGRYFLTTDDGPRTTDGASLLAVVRRPSSVVSLSAALRASILARREPLAAFIRDANVQTNETGRGLVWLLPVAYLGWPAVHLVELGASAGLNLVAERRGYRLVDAADPTRVLLDLGDGPSQFIVPARGAAEIPPLACCPAILSRTGGDVAPFHLRSAADELTLASFVWGDQTRRMERLREGVAALRSVENTAASVRLLPLRLPDDLASFLTGDLPQPLDAPVIIYNTTVTMYLPDHGAALRGIIEQWATTQRVPVLWLQWEPWWDGPPPPENEWFTWTADYWPNDGSEPRHWLLAWVHPHGTALIWGPDWAEFLRKTMQN